MTPPDSDLATGQQHSGPSPRGLVVSRGLTVLLLAAVVAQMVAAAIQSVTDRAPIFAGGQIGGLPVQVPHLSISLADRLSIFARTGANLTVALVLVVAIVALARSYRRGLIIASVILASIVMVANVAVGIEVLRGATGALSGFGQTNRMAGLLECLAPVGLSIGVLCGAGTDLGRDLPARS